MADAPEPNKADATGAPAPEVLRPRADDGSTPAPSSTIPKQDGAQPKRARRVYRPSHKATFIAMFVIVLLLAINAGVIAFVINRQSKADNKKALGAVTLDTGALSSLGLNRSSVGNAHEQLTVTPNSKFTGNVAIAGNVSIGKDLTLNTKFTAPDAALAQLSAGKTSLASADINGDATATNLSLRSGLQVAGTTHFQGPVTVSQLLTVSNSLNVAGNLTIGGVLTVGGFSARSLTSTSTLTIGGHVITSGQVPGSGPGGAVGPSGTVSVSGNDSSGTVAVNTGGAPSAGILANIAFRTQYGNTPHVVITPVGAATGSLNFYINRSIGGFSIGTSSVPVPGTGYVFDYIVEQ